MLERGKCISIKFTNILLIFGNLEIFLPDFPLIGDRRKESVIYKFTAAIFDSKKVYLGLTEGEFKKQRCYDHVKSSWNEINANSITLSSYAWKMKKKKKKKCNTSSYMGNFAIYERIFQHNKKMFLVPPRETSGRNLLIS